MTTSTRILLAVFAAILGLSAPLRAQTSDSVTPATTPTTGKFVFNFTLTLSSTVPKNGLIVCTAFANVFESSSGQNISENAAGIATLSGGKWSCTATMPYSWLLVDPKTDTVVLSYKVELADGLQVTATNGTTTTIVPFSIRKVNQNIASIPVPLNGATTTESVSSTL
jgi:hypothetical protein